MLCVAGSMANAEIASWYGIESETRTASGERFNPNAMTAAHRTLPFGTRVRVCHDGRSVTVRINDRGPAKWTHRDIDLSEGAAKRIRCGGVCRVQLHISERPNTLKHGDWGFF